MRRQFSSSAIPTSRSSTESKGFTKGGEEEEEEEEEEEWLEMMRFCIVSQHI
jgi:L-amino acid N-acyltransferase YncA